MAPNAVEGLQGETRQRYHLPASDGKRQRARKRILSSSSLFMGEPGLGQVCALHLTEQIVCVKVSRCWAVAGCCLFQVWHFRCALCSLTSWRGSVLYVWITTGGYRTAL